MHAYKLDRMEQVVWDPPSLTFILERHGAKTMGSSRAELHQWTLDVECGIAVCGPYGYRQTDKRQASVDVEAIAADIAEKIIGGASDPRINHKKAIESFREAKTEFTHDPTYEFISIKPSRFSKHT